MISGMPIGLKNALESGDCVLFLGAGIASHMVTPDGKVAPDGATLSQELAKHFGVDTTTTDLAKIAQVVEVRQGRPALDDFVRKRLANLQPDDNLRWLLARRWQAIFTTNYDSCIERAYELNDKPHQNPVSIAATHEVLPFDQRIDVPIFHLHGALFGRHIGGIVITETDYITFRDRRRMLFSFLKHRFATAPILYIGYSNQDPNWKLVWEEMSAEFFPSIPPTSYRVSPSTDPLDVEILKSKGIETIAASFSEFCAIASTSIADTPSDLDRLLGAKALVPTQLLPVFEKNPAAVTRLVASWTYVNQAPFTEQPNSAQFLWGDRPNWGLIGGKHYFARDYEEDIADDVLDIVTGNSTVTSVLLVLGPAGYGVTTLLMSLAVRLVQEGATTVFMHKPGTSVVEGDLLFAATLSKQPTIFFVDDGADHVMPLNGVIAQLRANKLPAIIVIGERLNEWRQRRAPFSGKEFVLEPLSDTEIDRLLDCLSQHNALNKLQPLSRELQVAVVKEKHGKELLVAMKEATEGMGFDAILEGEFRGIETAFARSAYLATACSYQFGTYLRDGVLAAVQGVNIVDLYENTKGLLDGVVVYDCIDESSGTYGARTRHRTVAEIVWERCGDLSDRERMLQLALEHLNLNYSVDAQAFDRFVRTDRMVSSIRTLEGKIQFFETACRKDPTSPYVRQHYARMLSREGKSELALAQVEEGLKLRGDAPPRVLLHTKGVILSRLMAETDSESFARRRMVQAEEAFRRAMNLNQKDEYTYQGMASLCLAWAKRVANQQEAADYISKAEVVISDGLRKVKERDGLWILTSEIEQWLGNTPSHVKALESAVSASPGSVIARYLLGRTYRRNGLPEKSIEVLEPVIKGHPDEYRSFIEYALALLDCGKPYDLAIAILNISTTYGLSDARFVATLGGMLFMSTKYQEARKVFQETVRREFPPAEATAIHFTPRQAVLGLKIPIQGRVTVVKPHFALIEAEGIPTFICPASKLGSTKLNVGIDVEFEVEFSAKGPIAINPKLTGALRARTA